MNELSSAALLTKKPHHATSPGPWCLKNKERLHGGESAGFHKQNKHNSPRSIANTRWTKSVGIPELPSVTPSHAHSPATFLAAEKSEQKGEDRRIITETKAGKPAGF